MDLRDVVHCGDTRVELTQRAEQLVDEHVLRPVHPGKLAQNVIEVVDRAVRLAVVRQAQRRFELVVMRVDEARNHDLAARVDHRGPGSLQLGVDGNNLLALDQDGGLREITHSRVHGQNGAPANDVTAGGLTGARRRCGGLRIGSARSEWPPSSRGDTGRRRGLQEGAPGWGMDTRRAGNALGCRPPREQIVYSLSAQRKETSSWL